MIARRPGNIVCKVGRRPEESAVPTAREVTESLKISVYGHPSTKGVDEPKRPDFETNNYSGEREKV